MDQHPNLIWRTLRAIFSYLWFLVGPVVRLFYKILLLIYKLFIIIFRIGLVVGLVWLIFFADFTAKYRSVVITQSANILNTTFPSVGKELRAIGYRMEAEALLKRERKEAEEARRKRVESSRKQDCFIATLSGARNGRGGMSNAYLNSSHCKK